MKDHPQFAYILTSALATLVVTNICIAVMYLVFKPLDLDEFQHMHIAWNVYHNEKIIFKEFWDNHGVLYPFVNNVIFTVFEANADTGLFMVLRSFSFVYLLCILVFTYAIAKKVSGSLDLSLLSVSILSSLYFFVIKGVEVRPDVLQNLFWFSGILVVLYNLKKRKSLYFYLAGLLFGLAVLCNPKALIGLCVVGLFFVGSYLVKNETFISLLKTGLYLLAGTLTVILGSVLYFAAVGGLYAYYENVVLFNYILITSGHPSFFPILFDIFLKHQIPFLLACAGGIYFLVFDFKKSSIEKLFLLFVAVATSLGALLGLFSQFYLMFLPLLSIVAAYGIQGLVSSIQSLKLRFVFILLLLVSFFYPMERFLIAELAYARTDPHLSVMHDVYTNEYPSLSVQQKNIEDMLKKTERNEAIGYFWNFCGNAPFNEDVHYYWGYIDLHGRVFNTLRGSVVYSTEYIEALQEKNVRYIVATQANINELPQETQDYISEQYDRVSVCLLEQKGIR